MDLKRTISEDIFQQSFDHYLAFLELLDVGIEVCELIFNDKGEPIDYILHDFNQIFERMLKLARSKMLGKRVTEFEPDLARTDWLKDYAKAVKTGKAARFEEYSKSLDTWYGVIVLPLKKENWFAIIITNITRSRMAEITLKESKEKYQDLIETTNDFIWEIDAQGRFTYCSPQVEKLWGTKLSDMIGESPFDKIPFQKREKALEAFNSLKNSPRPFNGVEFPIFDGSGELIFSETNVLPFFDAKGKLLGFRGITRDITERKKAEEALRRSEQHLRLHTRNSPLAVIDFDANFVVTRWSGQAEKMFGWTAKERIGKSIMDLHMIYEPDIPNLKETMRKLTIGNLQVTESNRNVAKNGKILHCTWYNSVLVDEKGKTDSVMSLVEDNTARVEAEEALKRRSSITVNFLVL